MARLSVHDGRIQPHGGGDELADWCQAVDGPNPSCAEGCRGSYHILVRGAWGMVGKAIRPILFLGTDPVRCHGGEGLAASCLILVVTQLPLAT